MKIKSVLVSQPEPATIERSPFYEISGKYKVNINYCPFIKVEGVSLKEFRSQRLEILDHSAVIFTSRTTVDSFFHICEEARVTVPETMKYFCYTEAVALYLQKYIVYRKRKIFFADGKFNSFMELILKHKNEKFLLTLTEPHNPELGDTMEKLKLNVNRVIMAKTIGADLCGLNIKDYDLMVFYSPAEINALVSNFGIDSLPLIAAFGNSTVAAACAAGLKVNTMAPTPEAPSMVRAVELFINKINSGDEIPVIEIEDSCKSEEFLKTQESKPSKKPRTRKKTEQPTQAKATKKAPQTKKP